MQQIMQKKQRTLVSTTSKRQGISCLSTDLLGLVGYFMEITDIACWTSTNKRHFGVWSKTGPFYQAIWSKAIEILNQTMKTSTAIHFAYYGWIFDKNNGRLQELFPIQPILLEMQIRWFKIHHMLENQCNRKWSIDQEDDKDLKPIDPRCPLCCKIDPEATHTHPICDTCFLERFTDGTTAKYIYGFTHSLQTLIPCVPVLKFCFRKLKGTGFRSRKEKTTLQKRKRKEQVQKKEYLVPFCLYLVDDLQALREILPSKRRKRSFEKQVHVWNTHLVQNLPPCLLQHAQITVLRPASLTEQGCVDVSWNDTA